MPDKTRLFFLSLLLKNLILGGAAIYRCDDWLVFNAGFSR